MSWHTVGVQAAVHATLLVGLLLVVAIVVAACAISARRGPGALDVRVEEVAPKR